MDLFTHLHIHLLIHRHNMHTYTAIRDGAERFWAGQEALIHERYILLDISLFILLVDQYKT